MFLVGSDGIKWLTPLKANMEPENHPIEKENHFSKPPFLGSMGVSYLLKYRGYLRLNFQGIC